jgi:hypothetical protein
MSTVAVLKAHAHQRVSFGVRSGKTLLPVEIKVTQIPQVVSNLQAGWNPSTNVLQCPEIWITATTKSLGGLINLTIWQDIHSTRTVTFEDGSYTYCQTPETSGTTPGYLADYDPTDPVVTSTDSQGNITCTFHDAPQLSIASDVRPFLLNVQYVATPRDFAMITVRSSALQTVAQVNWPVSEVATFRPSDMPLSSGTFTSTYLQSIQSPNPVISGTVYGTIPTSAPVPLPRTPSSNTYVSDTNNWHQNPSTESLANQHPIPWQ